MRPPHGGNVAAVAREFGLEPGAILDFSANLNPLAPAIPDDLWAGWRESLHTYPSPEPDLVEERLSAVYPVDVGNMTAVPGAVAGISASLELFSGRRALIPIPSFSEYPHLAQTAGLEVETLPADDWPSLPEQLRKQVRESDVVLLANPNNPTGDWFPTDELASMIGRTPAAAWIIDEAYADFVAQDQNGLLARLEDLPNLIVIRSLTKFWSVPGLRLGFIATANSDWTAQLRRRRLTWSIPALANPWSESFLTTEVYARISANLPTLFDRRNKLAGDLASLDGIETHLAATPYFLLSTDQNADELWRELALRNCLVRDATDWPGLPSHRYLRISPRSPGDNELLVAAVSASLLQPA